MEVRGAGALVVVGGWVELSYVKFVQGDDFAMGVIVWLVVVSTI